MALRFEACLGPFLLTVGVVALAAAGYCYFAPPAGPALRADQSDIEVTGGAGGEKREIVLRLHNESRQPMRVLGLTQC